MSKELFASICFIILMSGRETIFERHPSYIEEKLSMLDEGFNAYCYLDRPNQRLVQDYFYRWKKELPKEIIEYEKSYLNEI